MFFTEFYSMVYPLKFKEELPYLNVYIHMWLSYRSITNAKFYTIVYPTLDFMTKFWVISALALHYYAKMGPPDADGPFAFLQLIR